MTPGLLLTLDVGNTGLHAVYWGEAGTEPLEWRRGHDGHADWPDEWAAAAPAQIRAVGVSPAAEALWARRAEGAWGIEPMWLGASLPCPIEVAEGVEGVGMDRLAAAAGAWQAHRGPVLVVDAGTALTVDLVDAEGVFQGGAILPGLQMANRSLAAGADALERTDLGAEPPVWPARTTGEAMRTGVLTQAVAAVQEFHDRARFLAGSDPGLWLTGGDADLVLPHLGGEVHSDPLLVHRGLLAAEV